MGNKGMDKKRKERVEKFIEDGFVQHDYFDKLERRITKENMLGIRHAAVSENGDTLGDAEILENGAKNLTNEALIESLMQLKHYTTGNSIHIVIPAEAFNITKDFITAVALLYSRYNKVYLEGGENIAECAAALLALKNNVIEININNVVGRYNVSEALLEDKSDTLSLKDGEINERNTAFVFLKALRRKKKVDCSDMQMAAAVLAEMFIRKIKEGSINWDGALYFMENTRAVKETRDLSISSMEILKDAESIIDSMDIDVITEKLRNTDAVSGSVRNEPRAAVIDSMTYWLAEEICSTGLGWLFNRSDAEKIETLAKEYSRLNEVTLYRAGDIYADIGTYGRIEKHNTAATVCFSIYYGRISGKVKTYAGLEHIPQKSGAAKKKLLRGMAELHTLIELVNTEQFKGRLAAMAANENGYSLKWELVNECAVPWNTPEQCVKYGYIDKDYPEKLRKYVRKAAVTGSSLVDERGCLEWDDRLLKKDEAGVANVEIPYEALLISKSFAKKIVELVRSGRVTVTGGEKFIACSGFGKLNNYAADLKKSNLKLDIKNTHGKAALRYAVFGEETSVRAGRDVLKKNTAAMFAYRYIRGHVDNILCDKDVFCDSLIKEMKRCKEIREQQWKECSIISIEKRMDAEEAGTWNTMDAIKNKLAENGLTVLHTDAGEKDAFIVRIRDITENIYITGIAEDSNRKLECMLGNRYSKIQEASYEYEKANVKTAVFAGKADIEIKVLYTHKYRNLCIREMRCRRKIELFVYSVEAAGKHLPFVDVCYIQKECENRNVWLFEHTLISLQKFLELYKSGRLGKMIGEIVYSIVSDRKNAELSTV